MSFERIKNICLGVVIGAVAGLLLFAYFKPPKTIIKTEVEEVIVRDTIIVLKPTEIERRIVDTLYVAVRDTIVRNDTTYRAVVSGYSPRLESIEVYPTTIYRTKTEYQNQKFSLGIQVGIGYCGEIKPYIGIGVSYSLLRK